MHINTKHNPAYILIYRHTHAFIIHTKLLTYIRAFFHLSILIYIHTYMLVCINTDRHQFTKRNNFHTFSSGNGSNTATSEQNV